jgi:hypothetical protein
MREGSFQITVSQGERASDGLGFQLMKAVHLFCESGATSEWHES